MHKKLDKNIRKLTRIGKRSIGVIIPAEVLRDLHWKERQKVVVKKKGKSIIINDWSKEKRSRK